MIGTQQLEAFALLITIIKAFVKRPDKKKKKKSITALHNNKNTKKKKKKKNKQQKIRMSESQGYFWSNENAWWMWCGRLFQSLGADA